MKVLSVGKISVNSPATNFKGRMNGTRSNGKIINLPKIVDFTDSYGTSGVHVNSYHGKDAIYIPYSWEKESDAPKTEQATVDGIGEPFGTYNEYWPKPTINTDIPVVFDPAMTLGESLAEYLPTAKNEANWLKSRIKYNEENMKKELDNIEARKNDPLSEKISSFVHGGFHFWNDEKKMQQYNIYKQRANEARLEAEKAEERVSQIEETVADIQETKKKGNLLDVSVRNIKNPNSELSNYLKELQAKKSPSINPVLQKKVALPKDYLPLSTIILLSTGQTQSEIDSLVEENKLAIIKQAIKNPKLIENVEKTVTQLIGNND